MQWAVGGGRWWVLGGGRGGALANGADNFRQLSATT